MSRRFAPVIMLALLFAVPAGATTEFDQSVTPEVLFGSGNLNGSFTTDRGLGLEIALRGKERHDETFTSCAPDNNFNSNGDGTYSFPAGVANDGSSNCAGPNRPVWSFEWSVNTDYDNSSGLHVDDYAYEIGIDFEESGGTSFCKFDPITPTASIPLWDHAIGDNSTVNGAGSTAGDPGTYATLISTNNVAQNSWNVDFFDGPGACGPLFDPALDGTYDIYLAVKDKTTGQELARQSIQFDVGAGGQPAQVPMVGALGLGLLFAGLVALLGLGTRRFRTV